MSPSCVSITDPVGTRIITTLNPLDITNVAKTFGSLRALDGVSLDLRDREVLGLLGPNGAGKSTLVRTIMGRVIPDSGEVTIFGQRALPRDSRARERVGVVPQEIALYPLLSVRENLIVFGRYYGLSGADLDVAISTALEWSALGERADDITKNLSGGMKRRLNMAAGVLHKPRILLLDEPTVGVDPQSRERIYDMIERLRADGVSLIYTTHYMEEAERLCDRIAVIDHGRVIASGTQEELVQQTIGAGREVTIELTSGEKIVRTVANADEMLKFVKDLDVRDLSMRAPTLEKVFLHLTGRDLRE
jgi:ABC-2 type transport system ATP-binding protein